MLVKRPVLSCLPTEQQQQQPSAAPAACTSEPMSLLDLGYAHAGIDDGWQECDGYSVMPSNTSAFHEYAHKQSPVAWNF